VHETGISEIREEGERTMRESFFSTTKAKMKDVAICLIKLRFRSPFPSEKGPRCQTVAQQPSSLVIL
jgi:hypothetical protein